MMAEVPLPHHQLYWVSPNPLFPRELVRSRDTGLARRSQTAALKPAGQQAREQSRRHLVEAGPEIDAHIGELRASLVGGLIGPTPPAAPGSGPSPTHRRCPPHSV
jgi:hypothetical protein